jgi:probable phosphoglycerate mutase
MEDRFDDEAWGRLREVEHRWDAGDWGARLPGGESCLEIRARFTGVVERAVGEYADHDAGLVAVGHGGTLERGLPAICTNVRAEEARARGIPNCGVIETQWRDGLLRCVRWAGDELPPAGSDSEPGHGGIAP